MSNQTEQDDKSRASRPWRETAEGLMRPLLAPGGRRRPKVCYDCGELIGCRCGQCHECRGHDG